MPRKIRFDLLKLEILTQYMFVLHAVLYMNNVDILKHYLIFIADSVMRKAFVEVAKHANVSAQWKTLAKRLNVSDTQIEEVEEDFQGMRDRCFQSLVKWRENSGDDVDLTDLVQALKKCKFMAVAGKTKNRT